MISVLPIKDKQELKKLFCAKNIEFNNFSGGVSASCNEEVLGYCLYYLDTEKMTVLEIEPKEDIALADGILRSALHNAVCAKVIKAYYTDNSPIKLFKKLGFILSEEERTIDISKLFKSCHSCSDKNT